MVDYHRLSTVDLCLVNQQYMLYTYIYIRIDSYSIDLIVIYCAW